MASSSSRRTRVLLFGSQALSFREASLNLLKGSLKPGGWTSQILADLPTWWDTLITEFPHLCALPGRQLLESLAKWPSTASLPTPIPNILLTPLVVLSQLICYESSTSAPNPEDSEAVGFCTGLLSAYVVASSADAEQFRRHALRAACIAMFIGAFVDAEDATHGPSKSFSVMWNSPHGKEKLDNILQTSKDAYVAVSCDSNRVTVTCSASDVELPRQLQSAGLLVTEIGLRGRFHSRKAHPQLDALVGFCATHPTRLPDASRLLFPVWDGPIRRQGSVEQIAIRAILGDHCDWYAAFSAAVAAKPLCHVLSFGPERCVPPSLLSRLGSRLVHVAEGAIPPQHHADSVAVVGMSIKVAGADDLEEFWDLLCQGQSQHVEVPAERFDFETPWRKSDPDRKWYGNFLKDHDAFDHKFFRKSPREMASTDPQQRLLLQSAYQALQQSGYFRQPQDKHIGCYVGVGTVDYERNIGCYPANAFSATGNLKSFVAGKISHYFGWTGPALTIDTACSASAVAIHTACRAILSGECSAALAGGATVMSSPEWFMNLAGASFLSPTGPCKPFDAKADGYCRGEAIGTVFLKSMAQATLDGDQILGTIASTVVYQNENCTAITVPNAQSLSGLFRDVTKKANLQPEQVTYVEAHGTGTPVGDPAEYESVRRVFGGFRRAEPLSIGSVKGLVGHAECASGIVSLIKTVLMIGKGSIPPQASFTSLNLSIQTSPEDGIEITTKLKPWNANLRAALINNYGASGSNASMIVIGATPRPQARPQGTKAPFWLTGLDDRSLNAYSKKLRHFIKSRPGVDLQNLSFNLSRQSNRSLKRSLVFIAKSVDEVQAKLASFEDGAGLAPFTTGEFPKPVILCFGGQVSTFVGLDQHLYDNVRLLRSHLDECSAFCQAHGTEIYPAIFQRSPIEDTVTLQAALFATQYACAMSWIQSGVQPDAVVGHSFGELTALCVSGVLSLEDAVRMIIARAQLVRDSWGPEKGSMVAVEGDLADVQQLIEKASRSCDDGHPPAIACFNGPRSFTIAGSKNSIDTFEAVRANSTEYTGKVRAKRLNVSNAFHSSLVDKIYIDLEKCGVGFKFRKPTIHLERATETPSELTSRFLAEHMRKPVFFNQAVQRLARRHPSSIWLEAGSRSTVTTLASRALGNPTDGSHFQAVDITSENSYELFAETTASLWKQGLDVTFWAHHPQQNADYSPLLLPPYQFDKTKHWMELKKVTPTVVAEKPAEPTIQRLFTPAGYQDKEQRRTLFRINTSTKEFRDYVAGHTIAQAAPLCPSTLQLDITIEALMSIRPDYAKSNLYPQLQGLDNHAPMCLDDSRLSWLECECSGNDWDWKMVSHPEKDPSSTTLHVSGRLLFRSVDDPLMQNEFFKYQRLVGYDRCRDLLERADVDDVIYGRHIYKIFSEIVDYGETYRGLQRIVAKGAESAGRVHKAYTGKTWLDTPLWDSFCQVAGIYVNCMTDNDPSKNICISNRIDQWMRSPKLRLGSPRPETCEVLACHHRPSDKESLSDIFVFNPENGDLLEIILGVSYTRVSKASLGKMLLRLTGSASAEPARVAPVAPPVAPPSINPSAVDAAAPAPTPTPPVKSAPKPASDTYAKLKDLVSKLSGLEPHELADTTSFPDIGIDSLMGMELAREIEEVFSCTLKTSQLYSVMDMKSLMECVQSALGISEYDSDPGPYDANGESTDASTPSTTPTSTAFFDTCAYFAEQVGLDPHEVPMKAQLQDLGVDPLLGSALRTDLTTRFEIELPADATFLELRVQDINELINFTSQHTEAPAPVPISKSHAILPPHPPSQPLAREREPKLSTTQSSSRERELTLPSTAVLSAYAESKELTDTFVTQNKFGGYVSDVLPVQTSLCIAHTLEAFAKLGCGLDVAEGTVLKRVPHLPKHAKLVDYLYDMLDKAGKLIIWDGKQAVRTENPLPRRHSTAILEDLLRTAPEHSDDHRLTFLCGSKLAECLNGESDGIQLIFGSAEGRELVSNLYGRSPINQVWLKQMQDFLTRLVAKLPTDQGPLKVMEMGAGTGGATVGLAPLFASLPIPVEYTVSDISGSLVAGARKRFKHYPFMSFRVHDIEKEPAEELLGSQHIVISNNCVHATHSLTRSTRNIRSVLRPDGFLLMVEMTSTLYWVDMIFGLLEGWWFFDDGRNHAVAHQMVWDRKMRAAGYGHVDWTDGQLPEASIQRMLIAHATAPPPELLPMADCSTRQAVVDEYVREFSANFVKPTRTAWKTRPGSCVLITGATGSLGSHLVEHFANRADVRSVICMNRRTSTQARIRQTQAFESRGIKLPPLASVKITVVEADITQPMLGLSKTVWEVLAGDITHIIHNAWPMSIKRPIQGFRTQLQAMRNLIDLARRAVELQPSQIGFQFISSIATVGYYPLHGSVTVPEERMDVRSVLPSGYGDAKLVCEHLLDATLHQHPDVFRPMAVRIGQIAGSQSSGYWNPAEHFSFLVKSSQTLNALPDLTGHLSWCPVNTVAATLGDLLLADHPAEPIYHIENPAHQPWEEMIPWLADALQIEQKLPFEEWVRRVRDAGDVHDNPAFKVVDFLDEHFLRMSCGGLVLATDKSRRHSATLAGALPVGGETVRMYVAAWKKAGFL